ncbi:MAG: hypothetical protein QMC37_11735, partial [Flavobacteriales bacterium]
MTYIQDGLCSSTVHAKVLLAQLCDGRTLQCCGATWRLPPLAELTYLDLHFGYLLMDSRWPVGNIVDLL